MWIWCRGPEDCTKITDAINNQALGLHSSHHTAIYSCWTEGLQHTFQPRDSWKKTHRSPLLCVWHTPSFSTSRILLPNKRHMFQSLGLHSVFGRIKFENCPWLNQSVSILPKPSLVRNRYGWLQRKDNPCFSFEHPGSYSCGFLQLNEGSS